MTNDKMVRYQEPKRGKTTQWGTYGSTDKYLDEGAEVLVLGELHYTLLVTPGVQYLVTHPDIVHHSGYGDLDMRGTPYEHKCSWANNVEVEQ